MAKVATEEVSNVTMQEMMDAGLNPFAIQLLVESYARTATPPPLTFVWRGVVVSLKAYARPGEGSDKTQQGTELIAAERARQIEVEGWTPEHDDAHTGGEMAIAAAYYAWPAPRPLAVKKAWPWDAKWRKPAVPGGRIGFPEPHTPEEVREARMHDLVRAGALIAAELDRLQRCGS
jgi:hypothetical protein